MRDARLLHPVFQTALALFDALRDLGFESEKIFFTYTPNGMHVEVHHDGREWSLRAGDCDMSRDQWTTAWKDAAEAVASGEMSQESLDSIARRFAPFRAKLVDDLLRSNVRIPKPPGLC